MKNLANCTPREFMRQTARIKRQAEKWLDATKIMKIRARHAPIEDGMSDDEKDALIREQLRKNVSDMFDAAFEKHPDETLELIALMCFVEPADIDSHTIDEYMSSIFEMLNSESVTSFFTFLARLDRMDTVKR